MARTRAVCRGTDRRKRSCTRGLFVDVPRPPLFPAWLEQQDLLRWTQNRRPREAPYQAAQKGGQRSSIKEEAVARAFCFASPTECVTMPSELLNLGHTYFLRACTRHTAITCLCTWRKTLPVMGGTRSPQAIPGGCTRDRVRICCVARISCVQVGNPCAFPALQQS